MHEPALMQQRAQKLLWLVQEFMGQLLFIDDSEKEMCSMA
jgi:hypothetical protein